MSLIEPEINQLEAGMALNAAGNDIIKAMDGCEFEMWSAKTGKYAILLGNSMVWSPVPMIFCMRKAGGMGLQMSPKSDPTVFVGVTATGVVHHSGEQWLKYTSLTNNSYLVPNYGPWGRGMAGKITAADCAGSISIGHHFSMEHQMKNEGTHDSSITTTIGDSWFFFKFHKLSPWLDIKYTTIRIGQVDKLKRQCCMNDYIGALGDESCGVSGYLAQDQKCDNLMVDWCDRHPTDRECGCIKSPLGGSSFPVGCDTSCTRGASVYLIGPTARAVDAGCTHIECKQIVSMNPDQRSRVSDVHIKQHCADLVHSDAKSVGQALADQGKSIIQLEEEKLAREEAADTNYVASHEAPTILADINSLVAQVIPSSITSAIPDVGHSIIDNHKALFVLLLLILVIMIASGGSPPPPRQYPSYPGY